MAGNVSATVTLGAFEGPPLLATIVYVTRVPGTTLAAPSVFVIATSAWGERVSVSVALLLAVAGSVAPPPTVAVAVFLRVPIAAGEMVQVAVYVAEPPTGKLAVLLMLPDPDAAQIPPPAPKQVHVAPVHTAGNVSATVTLDALEGPALLATIAYVTDVPGTLLVVPSVFVIPTLAWGVRLSVSVALLFSGLGSMTPPPTVAVAVLTRLPVADAKMEQVAVYVTEPPTGRLTASLMFPAPAVAQAPPPAPEQVQVTPVQAAGNVSATVTVGALDGPATLLATTV
jgi:hypothetical protein